MDEIELLRQQIEKWKEATGCEEPEEAEAIYDPYVIGDSITYHSIRSLFGCAHDENGNNAGWGDYANPIKRLAVILNKAGYQIKDGVVEKLSAPDYQPISNLLSIVHRDGGQYLTKHGLKKACEDAVEIYYRLLSNQKE